VSDMEEPTLEEMKRYWGYQKRLEACDGCVYEEACWHHKGVAYKPEVMLKICPHTNVKEAIQGLQEMTKGKPLGFYAITGKWWACEELWKVIEG